MSNLRNPTYEDGNGASAQPAHKSAEAPPVSVLPARLALIAQDTRRFLPGMPPHLRVYDWFTEECIYQEPWYAQNSDFKAGNSVRQFLEQVEAADRNEVYRLVRHAKTLTGSLPEDGQSDCSIWFRYNIYVPGKRPRALLSRLCFSKIIGKTLVLCWDFDLSHLVDTRKQADTSLAAFWTLIQPEGPTYGYRQSDAPSYILKHPLTDSQLQILFQVELGNSPEEAAAIAGHKLSTQNKQRTNLLSRTGTHSVEAAVELGKLMRWL